VGGAAAAGGSESESKARLLCSLFAARCFRISVAAGAKFSSSSSSSGITCDCTGGWAICDGFCGEDQSANGSVAVNEGR